MSTFTGGVKRRLRNHAGRILRYLGLRRCAIRVLRYLGLWGTDQRGALSDECGEWEAKLKEGGRRWRRGELRDRLDPESELQESLKKLIDAPPGSVVRILDVGAGPLTNLGKKWQGRDVQIIATDPRAREFKELLERLSLRPPVETTVAYGEKLLDRFQENEFDLAYASNSLDHCQDPLAAIEQMVAVIKPDRYVYLWHFINEGLRHEYDGPHQWNFRARRGVFLVGDGRKTYSVSARLGDRAEVESEYTSDTHGRRVIVAKIRKLGTS